MRIDTYKTLNVCVGNNLQNKRNFKYENNSMKNIIEDNFNNYNEFEKNDIEFNFISNNGCYDTFIIKSFGERPGSRL